MVIVFGSGTENYFSLIFGVLFLHEIPLEGDSSLRLKEDN